MPCLLWSAQQDTAINKTGTIAVKSIAPYSRTQAGTKQEQSASKVLVCAAGNRQKQNKNNKNQTCDVKYAMSSLVCAAGRRQERNRNNQSQIIGVLLMKGGSDLGWRAQGKRQWLTLKPYTQLM